ncbi:MAG: sulfatase [Candidatus Aminicenantes bacterium]|nr:sulfatase [Candidatus Aminicenantes bacterium]
MPTLTKERLRLIIRAVSLRLIAAGLLLVVLTAGSAAAAKTKKLPNIVLVVLDSVRRDHLGLFGYARDTSPALSRLARDGVVFSDVVAQSSQTAPAVASILTGLNPFRHGIQFYGRTQSFDPNHPEASPSLDARLRPLAEILRARGYAAWGLSANPWLDPANGFGRGYDRYEFIPSWDGRHLNQAFSRYLDERPTGRPFFAYLHYMDAHAPYFHPETSRGRFAPLHGPPVYAMGFLEALTPTDLAYAEALYDEQLRNLDALLAALLESLRASAVIQDTIVLVTADHGEEFGDHGGMGHGTSLHAEQIGSFLVLWGAGGWKPGTIGTQVRHIDIFPTLLELVGGRAELGSIDGRSLWPLLRSESGGSDVRIGSEAAGPAREPGASLRPSPTVSELGDEKAAFAGGFKYIRNIWTGEEGLYRTDHDPAENENLADSDPARLAALRNAWRSVFGDGSPAPSVSSSRKTLTEAEVRRLESLGYLAGRSAARSAAAVPSRAPFTSRLAFDPPPQNPLQLVFGWKGQAPPAGERARTGRRVGPHVRFLLARGSAASRTIVIEGWWEGPLSGAEDPAPPRIRLELEGKPLGEAALRRPGAFRLEFGLPEGMGLTRPLPFALFGTHPLILFEIRS